MSPIRTIPSVKPSAISGSPSFTPPQLSRRLSAGRSGGAQRSLSQPSGVAEGGSQIASGGSEQLSAEDRTETGRAGDAFCVQVIAEAGSDQLVQLFYLCAQIEELAGEGADQRVSADSAGRMVV